jgi:hypothetical protein
MRVDDFKSNFIAGARPNLYRFEIQDIPEKLTFLAKSTQMPGATVGTIEYPFLNRKIKLAGDPTFEDLTVTISLDTDFAVKNELEEWLASINKNDEVTGAENINDYKKEATIIQLDAKGSEIAEYKYVGLYPNNMAPVEMSFETNDTVSEYTVTFSYDYWERVS